MGREKLNAGGPWIHKRRCSLKALRSTGVENVTWNPSHRSICCCHRPWPHQIGHLPARYSEGLSSISNHCVLLPLPLMFLLRLCAVEIQWYLHQYLSALPAVICGLIVTKETSHHRDRLRLSRASLHTMCLDHGFPHYQSLPASEVSTHCSRALYVLLSMIPLLLERLRTSEIEATIALTEYFRVRQSIAIDFCTIDFSISMKPAC